jgi:hypothetical protein
MRSVFAPKEQETQVYSKYVDIYKFFDILYELLSNMGILKTSVDQDGTHITFINAYPDDTYENQDYIIYEIANRKKFVHNTSMNNGSVTQVRPVKLEERYDIESGQVLTDYAYWFDNIIKISVWSTSSTKTHNLIQLLEAIILKSTAHLRQYVVSIVYQEQTPTVFIENYFKKRLFTKSILLNVSTKEVFTMTSEELQAITPEKY